MELTPEAIDLALLQQVAVNASPASKADIEIFTQQLGREPRGLLGVAARCACGTPAVTLTAPQLPDGSPFPTLFYLSLPWVVKEISRLESGGEMQKYNELLQQDPQLLANYQQAHESYVARRELLAQIPQLSGVSAGGMPQRVKCLHALAGYALAVGAGVCLVGDAVLAEIGWDWEKCKCAMESA